MYIGNQTTEIQSKRYIEQTIVCHTHNVWRANIVVSRVFTKSHNVCNYVLIYMLWE